MAIENAVIELLQRIPSKWEAVDPDSLTQLDEVALFKLVAAGLVQRQVSLMVTTHFGETSESNHAVELRCYGVQGLEEACALLSEKLVKRFGSVPTSIHVESLNNEKWRLTIDGVEAAKDVAAGDTTSVLDFVFERGYFGEQYAVLRLTSGCLSSEDLVRNKRPEVRGSGELVSMKEMKERPTRIEVANFDEQGRSLIDAIREVIPHFAYDQELEDLISKIKNDEELKHLRTRDPNRVKAYDVHLKAKKNKRYPEALAEYERRLNVETAEA